MDLDDIVKDVEQTLEWFCDRIVEPVPLNKQDKEKMFTRMINLGWIRQSEVETYNEITKDD
jgi:hypothetical protein